MVTEWLVNAQLLVTEWLADPRSLIPVRPKVALTPSPRRLTCIHVFVFNVYSQLNVHNYNHRLSCFVSAEPQNASGRLRSSRVKRSRGVMEAYIACSTEVPLALLWARKPSSKSRSRAPQSGVTLLAILKTSSCRSAGTLESCTAEVPGG